MPRKESEQHDQERTKKFIEQNWPVALAIAGAGVVGAAIWLTARYLREKKKRDTLQDHNLKVIEKEAEMVTDESAALLESGTYLGEVAGDEGRQALIDLASQMDDDEAREALELIHQTIDTNRRRKR